MNYPFRLLVVKMPNGVYAYRVVYQQPNTIIEMYPMKELKIEYVACPAFHEDGDSSILFLRGYMTQEDNSVNYTASKLFEIYQETINSFIKSHYELPV